MADVLEFGYTNWRGESARRRVYPLLVYRGETKWHTGEGWLLEAIDAEKGEARTFALKDVEWDDSPYELAKLFCDAMHRHAASEAALAAAIREHHNQRADDRCWLDDRKLYEAAGLPTEKYDQVGSPSEMLKNCERFVTYRCSGGGDWKSYAELEAENARLRQELADLKAARRLIDDDNFDVGGES